MCIRDRTENEYAVLERSIQSVQRENWALSELNRGQEETLRRRFLASLLQGSLVDAYEIEGVLRECGMKLAGDGYAVAVFGLHGTGTVSYTHLDVYKRQSS